MNKFVKVLAMLMALMLCVTLTACAGKQGNGDAAVNYSLGLTTDGRYDGVNLKDYVTLGQYTGIQYDESTLTVKEEDIQKKIDSIMSSHTYKEDVTDRAVEDGDTLNIDYVGKVDGVEFEGGSTKGAGTEVTIGVTSYIDDFLEQLIGHKPGETFDINVTFPDPYQNNPDLAGKEATFTVTINKIIVTHTFELTDDFVMENLNKDYGYTSVENMRETIAKDLRESQVTTALMETIFKNCTVSEVPQKLVDNEVSNVIKQLKFSALQYSLDYTTLMSYYYGVDSEEAFRTKYEEDIRNSISQYMTLLAIAEQENLIATEQNVKDYFKAEMDADDISSYVEQYGYGYIYRAVTINNVGEFLTAQNPAPSYTEISEIIVPAVTDNGTDANETNTEGPAA